MVALSKYSLAQAVCALFPLAMLAACGQSDEIDADGTVFSEIAPDAAVTLTGTEPFWNFEISPLSGSKYIVRYTTPENTGGTVFSLARFAGNNGLGFSGELEGKSVQIAITPGKCNDGMSDRTFPFTATVAMGDATLQGCAYTSDTPFTGSQAP